MLVINIIFTMHWCDYFPPTDSDCDHCWDDCEIAAMTDILEFSDIYQEVKGSWVSRHSYYVMVFEVYV